MYETSGARTGLPAHPLTLCMGRKPYVTGPWRYGANASLSGLHSLGIMA